MPAHSSSPAVMVVKARRQLLERLLGRCSAGRSRCGGGAALPRDRARNAKPADGAGIAASAWVLELYATGTQRPNLTPGVETNTAAVINRTSTMSRTMSETVEISLKASEDLLVQGVASITCSCATLPCHLEFGKPC